MDNRNINAEVESMLEGANSLSQIKENIARIVEELTGDNKEISDNWGSDTADRDSYLSKLNTELGRLYQLVGTTNSLCQAIRSYAYTLQQEANKG